MNNVRMFGKAAESASDLAKRRVEAVRSDRGRAAPAGAVAAESRP
jgi:hypothetical protein